MFLFIRKIVAIVFLFLFSTGIYAQCSGNMNIDFAGDRCVGNEITFLNTSTGNNIQSYNWFFDSPNNPNAFVIPDDSTANARNVTHTYTVPGNYTVRVVRRCGFNKQTRTINLQVAQNPQKPIIVSSGNNDCGGNKDINYSIQNQNGGFNYIWNFGDPAAGSKNTATGNKVTHAFSATGSSANFQVTVEAKTQEGCKTTSDIRTESIKSTPKINVVDGDPNFNTNGNFTRCLIDGNSVDSIYLFSFDNQSVSDDPNTTYSFDWGDGKPSQLVPTGTQVSHQYETFGVSNLVITAQNTVSNCTKKDTIKIVNEKFPSASLSIPPASVNICDSTAVNIDNNSKNATNYVWYWGTEDSTLTDSKVPVNYLFKLDSADACSVTNALGYQINVKLKALNSCFTHDNTSPINVRPKPVASFTANTGMVICFTPNTSTYNVTFALSSCPSRTIAGFATTYKFEIEDPNNPINQTINPNQSATISHTFTASGAYPIKMTASNFCGADIVFDTLYISDPAIAKFGNDQNTAVSSVCTQLNLPDMSPASNCGPFLLDLKNLSQNLLQTDQVNWTVTPTGAVFGSSNAVSSQSYNDNVAFDIGKTYTLTLSVSNKCNVTPSTACAIVRVKDIPTLDATVLAGFEGSGFNLTKGNPNVPPQKGDTLEYSKCDKSTLNTLFIKGLDDSTKTYDWMVNTVSGSTTGFANPTDSLPGAITFEPGKYNLNVKLGNECGDTVSNPVRINILTPEIVSAGGAIPLVSACKDTSFKLLAGKIKEIVHCAGDQFQLGNNLPKAGVIYTWTSLKPTVVLDSTNKPNTTVTIANNDTANICQVVTVKADNGACAKLDSVLLVVKPTPKLSIGLADTTLCTNTDAFILNFSPSGGIWTADSVGIVTPLGGINPRNKKLVTHKLTYTYIDATTTCEAEAFKNIIFADSTPVTISLDTNICESDIAFQINANPLGGIFTSSAIGAISTQGMLTSSVIGKGNLATIFYNFIDSKGCKSSNTDFVQVTDPIIPNPGLADSICANETNLQLNAITPSGIWIDTTATFSLTAAGVFNPNGLPSATYQVYYQINTGTPCVQRSPKNIFVKPLPILTIVEPIGPFCAQDNPAIISASPSGGVWTSPNTSVSVVGTDTLFAPIIAGQNATGHTLSYAFTNSFNCTVNKNTTVQVFPLPTVFAGNDLGICQNNTPFQLTGFTPSGGGVATWEILNTSFNAISNTALYSPDSIAKDTIQFNFSLASGCNQSDTIIVSVLKPVKADAGLIDSLCLTNGTFPLQSGVSTPFNVGFGSQWTGLGVATGTNTIDLNVFAPTDLNISQEYIYRYGTGNCQTFDTTYIKVFSLPTITPPSIPNNALCEDASVVEIFGYEAFTQGVTVFDSTFGAWAGAGISKQGNRYFFDPNAAGASGTPINLTYTYTDAITKNCVAIYDHKVSVEALPIPDFTIPAIYCVDAELTIANNSSIAFGSLDSSFWSFTPIDSLKEKFAANTKFTFDSAGFYTIQYKVVSDKGCDSALSKQIQIISPPKAQFTLNTNPINSCGPVTAIIQDQSTGFDSTYIWNFGLDNVLVTSYLPNDTSLVFAQGSITDTNYVIQLIVTNLCASDTLLDSVRVLPTPIASFGTDKSIGCSPAEFEFNNNSLGYIDGQNTFYTFTFSDGSAGFGPVTHRIINNKRFELGPPKRSFVYNGFNDTTYTIRMVAVNACGSDTAFQSIKVLPNDVKAFFNQNLNEGCSPLQINYTDFSTNSDFVAYDFGDSTTQVGRNVSHTFVNKGTQTKEFFVQQFANNACSKDTVVQSIKVFAIPQADFQIRANATCQKDSILFVNQSKGSNSSTWIFETVQDTIRNINSEVWYQFDTSGTQVVKLVVAEPQHNCTDTIAKTIVIHKVPRSVFDNDTIEACEPFLFTQSLQFENADDQFFWVNHLGDTVSRFKDIEYNYPDDGDFTMILISKAKSGCINIDSILVDVAPSPAVSFDVIKPTDLCVFPKDYSFQSTSSIDVQQFKWYLDGVPFDSLDASSQTFVLPDTVEIALFAKNNFNCFDTETKEVIINPLPKADFGSDDLEGCEPYVTRFKNNSMHASEFVWNFGDGFSAETQDPSHLYTDGLYDIRLVASNSDGCKDTLVRNNYITVLNKPIADFDYTHDPETTNYGLLHFTSLSKDATFYNWDFGNAQKSTDSTKIDHTFDFYGEQTITLVALNESTCSDTITKVINVKFFGGLYVPNAFSPSSGNPNICVFKPVGFGLKTYHCQVFDTWGNLIWESTELENGAPAKGWDGRYKGEPLPENAYVWKIEATFIDGYNWEGMQYEGDNSKRKVGTVTLVR